MPRSAPSWRRMAWELLVGEPDARPCRRRRRRAARVCGRARSGLDGARRAAADARHRDRCAGAALHARDFAGRRAVLRHHPGREVRDAAAGRSVEGRRPAVERRTRTSPRAQHARRRRDRAGGRAAGGLRADDPDVPGDAPGQPGIRQARRGAHAARVDPVVARRRPRGDDAHARADCPPHRTDSRRHRGRRLVVDHDGRIERQRSDLRRGLSRTGRPDPAAPPLQTCRRRLSRGDGQSCRRRAIAALDRQLRARARGRGERELRQRILEAAVGGDRQADQAEHDRPVAHDSRRRGRRAGRRRGASGAGDRLLAGVGGAVLGRESLRSANDGATRSGPGGPDRRRC